jgi:hypothetical protein
MEALRLRRMSAASRAHICCIGSGSCRAENGNFKSYSKSSGRGVVPECGWRRLEVEITPWSDLQATDDS